MKLPCLILFTITSLFVSNALGDDVHLDNHFFIVMTAALDASHPFHVKQWRAMSLDEKRTNAQALYLLDVNASQTEGLSNAVRLAVAASATRTFGYYIGSIPTSDDFITSSDFSAALFLLDDSQKLLDRIPARQNQLNVGGGPGVAAAGMDPSGVSDPKVRADYERRIAENDQALEENNNRHYLDVGMVSLESSLCMKINYLAAHGKAGPFTNAIEASSLPADVKAKLLEKR